MSGEKWNYDQYRITDIADEIENIVKNNNVKNSEGFCSDYSSETIKAMLDGVYALRVAQVYAQRVDWLCSDDDGEDSFIERLKEDLDELKTK